MKICAVICEYNPFHNGHRYLLDVIRKTERFDRILCIMSGCFTQRGEIAVTDPYTRARHALLGGADAVIELPTLFATSSAELFASGAIQVLSSISEVEAIAFGAEHATPSSLDETATFLLEESPLFQRVLKEKLEQGMGYARARALALQASGKSPSLLCAPNDILAVEYTKAILKRGANIERICIPRKGQGYLETHDVSSFASASALRAHREDLRFLERNMPSYAVEELSFFRENPFQIAVMTALARASTEELNAIFDCSEGLEYALKQGGYDYSSLIDCVAGKRYAKSRIRRILLHNLLKITRTDISNALQSPLYLHLLAAKDNSILSVLGGATYPLLTKGRDALSLPPIAKRTRDIDLFAEQMYEICSGIKIVKKIFENKP